MSIGGKLKELRILKGLTQEELADRAELSKGFISQVERDLTSPSIATLMDILQCLGTTIGEFFNEAPEEQIAAMRAYGTNLGIAFQIKDDILDYSPMEVTGKPMCGDMRERKITLPLLYVLENCSETEHRKLIGKLSDIRQKPDNVEYLARTVRERGGLEHAAEVMAQYRDKALASLESYPDSPIRESLRKLAYFVLERNK